MNERSKSVLIVEDEQTSRQIFHRQFRNADATCSLAFAASLAEAEHMIASRPWTAIVLDNCLPDGMGCDFAHRMAQHAKKLRTRLYLVTNHPSPFFLEKAMGAGVVAVISKAQFSIRMAEMVLDAAPVPKPQDASMQKGFLFVRNRAARAPDPQQEPPTRPRVLQGT